MDSEIYTESQCLREVITETEMTFAVNILDVRN
jgi:hypothetical protein